MRLKTLGVLLVTVLAAFTMVYWLTDAPRREAVAVEQEEDLAHFGEIIFSNDPAEPAASWAERKRLFALPRASWAEYDRALISRGGTVQLAPAFDFLNTTIAIRNAAEEIALPIRGRKSRLTRSDFFDYFARERLELNDRVIEEIVGRFGVAMKEWPARIDHSFLSPEMKAAYRDVLEERRRRILPGD